MGRSCQPGSPETSAHPAVAEPAPLSGDLLHLLADFGAVRRAFAPGCLWVDTDKPAGPALRDAVIPHRPERCRAPLGQRRQFFPRRSFRTTLSSIVSASSRFSLAFSFGAALGLMAPAPHSSAFSRAASDTSMPPYLDFSL